MVSTHHSFSSRSPLPKSLIWDLTLVLGRCSLLWVVAPPQRDWQDTLREGCWLSWTSGSWGYLSLYQSRSRVPWCPAPRATLSRRWTLPLPPWELVPLPGCTLTPAGRRKLCCWCYVLHPHHTYWDKVVIYLLGSAHDRTIFTLVQPSQFLYLVWNRGLQLLPHVISLKSVITPGPSCFPALLPFNPHGGPSPSCCLYWLLTVLRLCVLKKTCKNLTSLKRTRVNWSTKTGLSN